MILVDSDIIIDAQRGDETVPRWFGQHAPGELFKRLPSKYATFVIARRRLCHDVAILVYSGRILCYCAEQTRIALSQSLLAMTKY